MTLIHFPRRRRGGFSLMELMVVIAIMALLATLTLMGFRYAQKAAMRNRTTAFMKGVSSGLESYHSEFGEYPRPKRPTMTSQIAQKTYNVGGALMLYQALSGDGDTEIEFLRRGHGTFQRKIEGVEIARVMMKEMPVELWRRDTSGYILVDGFSHPFQYQAPNPANKTQYGIANNTTNSETINPTYDLWSGDDDQHVNQTSLDAKKSDVVSAKWIKNW